MSLQQVTTNSCDMKDKPVIVEYIHSTSIHTYKFSLSFYYIIHLSVEHTPHALHGWEMMMTTLRVYCQCKYRLIVLYLRVKWCMMFDDSIGLIYYSIDLNVLQNSD